MGAFIFQGIGTIISKLFYITGKTRIFSFIGIIEILLYISLSYFLLKDLSFLSLSFSLSLSTFLSLSLSMFYIHKKIIQLSFKKLFTDFSKILIASLVFISVTYLLNNIICNNTNILILVLITIFSSTLFLITSFYLKIEEIVIICTKIKNYNSNI
jgi:peptidoglycan biosynthesis protein MviN/MurJ (putative lipid II flippase)